MTCDGACPRPDNALGAWGETFSALRCSTRSGCWVLALESPRVFASNVSDSRRAADGSALTAVDQDPTGDALRVRLGSHDAALVCAHTGSAPPGQIFASCASDRHACVRAHNGTYPYARTLFALAAATIVAARQLLRALTHAPPIRAPPILLLISRRCCRCTCHKTLGSRYSAVRSLGPAVAVAGLAPLTKPWLPQCARPSLRARS
jgi:hypothetical protein